MDYIGIATRSFGQGRITISTDRLSSWRSTNYGDGFWRSMFEWVGQKKSIENIKIAIIDSIGVYPPDAIRAISPVSYTTTTIPVISKTSLDDLLTFDVLYFIGSPQSITDDIKTKISSYVNKGGGLHIETPSISGEIEILSGIESINVTDINPPDKNVGNWTDKSASYPARQKDIIFTILNSIEINEFGDEWDILISSVSTIYEKTTPEEKQTIRNGLPYNSSFAATAGVYFKDGVVLVEEEHIGSSESSSSESSWSSDSSSESSWSGDTDERPWVNQYTELVAANGVALWNLVTDGVTDNPIVPDGFKNLYNMAIMKKAGLPSSTISNLSPLANTVSQTSAVEYNLRFNGVNLCAETIPNEFLNLDEFSVSLWVKYTELKSCVFICKSGIWEIGMDSPFAIYIKRQGFDKYTTEEVEIEENAWVHIVVNAAVSGTAEIYINSVLCSCVATNEPLSALNPASSPLVIGSTGAYGDKFFQGEMSKIIVLNRVVSPEEVETLYSYTSTINPRPLEYQSIFDQLTP